MKKKKFAVIALALAFVLAASYVMIPGFSKMGSVCISDYSVSEDGMKMTLTVSVTSSAGYVRKVAERQQREGALELDCYAAFGGINGSWGAKAEHTIRLLRDTEVIAIYRSAGQYEPVLEKNENGTWQPVEAK